MGKITRIAIGSMALVLALMGGAAAWGEPPIASAAHVPPRPMLISASGGDHTSVDRDGTEGDFTDSVQGRQDSDGDQDAKPVTNSEEATPQVRATNKMTKR